MKASVFQNIDATRSAGLSAILNDHSDGTSGLLDKVLVNGTKTILELVPSLRQLDNAFIAAIRDGTKLITEMTDPFKNIDDIGLKAMHSNVWPNIANLHTVNDAVKISKLDRLKETAELNALKSALGTDGFSMNFGLILEKINACVLFALDRISIKKLEFNISPVTLTKFNPSEVAQAGLIVTGGRPLPTAAADTNPSTKVFRDGLCAAFSNAADYTSKVGVAPTGECFSSFSAPLAAFSDSDIGKIIKATTSGTTTTFSFNTDSGGAFPAGFNESRVSLKVIKSIQQSVWNLDNNQLNLFLDVIKKNWAWVDDKTDMKIDGKQLGSNSIHYLLTLESADKIESFNGPVAKLNASHVAKSTSPFYGITKAKLLDLSADMWTNLKTATATGIPFTEFKAAYNEAASPLQTHVDFSKLNDDLLVQFDSAFLDAVKDKLSKENWSKVPHEKVALMTNFTGATNLKAALQESDAAYDNLKTAVCGKFDDQNDLVAVFPGLTLNMKCFKYMKAALKSYNSATDLVNLSTSPPTFKATVFPSGFVGPDFGKEIAKSLHANVLNGTGNEVKFICGHISSLWLDVDGKLNAKSLSLDCSSSISRTDYTKWPSVIDASVVDDYLANNIVINSAPGPALALFIPNNPSYCSHYSNIGVVQKEVQIVMSDGCFKKIAKSNAADRSKNVKMHDLGDQIFPFLTVDDVSSGDWSLVTAAQLEKLKPISADSANSDEYKKHPCSKLTEADFQDKLSADTRKKVKEICKKKTNVGNDSAVVEAAFSLLFACVAAAAIL